MTLGRQGEGICLLCSNTGVVIWQSENTLLVSASVGKSWTVDSNFVRRWVDSEGRFESSLRNPRRGANELVWLCVVKDSTWSSECRSGQQGSRCEGSRSERQEEEAVVGERV